MVIHIYKPCYTGGRRGEYHGPSLAQSKSKTLSKAKGDGGTAQMVECLPSQCKVLSSNPVPLDIIHKNIHQVLLNILLEVLYKLNIIFAFTWYFCYNYII
jgi:hypothetical protein